MLRLTILQSTFSNDTQEYTPSPVAVIDVDENGATLIDGPGEMFVRMRVPDVDVGASIRVTDDPYRWAELMVDYVASGDLSATVEQVTSHEQPATYVVDAQPAVMSLQSLTLPQR